MDSIIIETEEERAQFHTVQRDALFRTLLEHGASGAQANACADLAMELYTTTTQAFRAVVETIPDGPVLTNAASCAICMIIADMEANLKGLREVMAAAGNPMQTVAVRLAQ